MSKDLLTGRYRVALNLCAAGALAALMSGCSADATRLGDPFGNPFSSASNDQPKAVRRHVASRDVIPAGRTPPVTSTALAPSAVSVASLSPSRPAFRAPVSAETTGSIDRGPVRTASGPSFGGWSSAGGTPIQVADGETAEIIGKRYGVPTNALLQVNGLRSAAEVRPGTQITIPIYTATGREAVTPTHVAEAEPRVEAPVRKAETVPARVTTPASRVAAATPHATKVMAQTTPATKGGTAKMAAARTTPVSTASLQPHPLGKLPVGKAVASAPMAAPLAKVAPQVAKAEPAAAPAAMAKPAKVAAVAPAAASVAPQAAPPPAAAAAPAAAVAENNPEFRWPARGRIIQGFKGGSGGNDGINIAVPEGTSVKAAEGGVVAYAGSELKGYGNLVLIRHPNGYVTAYANNGEIDVKRGETVKRGQQIAKSGQSGNVSSPQLHFELRKGSTPIDPTQYLAGL